MSADEVRTRISQEVSKRLDLALFHVHLAPPMLRIRPLPETSAQFFFGKDRDEMSHRAALLRAQLPHEADAIIHEADDICRHEFSLLGYDKIDYGPIIDWHSDPVHGKRSPLKPWFKIKFLDFNEVGDHKVIWELNRHQHLVTLAKAWLLTGNKAYPTELVKQWYSWRQANPYPVGINWASALEVAFRSLSWLRVRSLVAGCPEIPAAFQTDILLALQSHGRYIRRYMSTYFSPNTHLLGEAVALFYIGTLCPEIPGAKLWRKKGWRIVLEESNRQVRPDGVYFEQSLYYHVYALDFWLHARHLAQENGVIIPEPFDIVLRKMLDVVQALSELGPPEGFGDDDGGRVFNPRRNQVACMTDPLALGAILYGGDDYTPAVTEEAIWLFGDKSVEATKKRRPRAVVSRAFTAGGIYLLNDDESVPQQLMIDAGPQGIGHSGHGHADALSLRFSLNGQRVLVDPGAYCYISPGPERDWFRSTGAHNTVRVDNLDQAVPDGPFAWNSIPRVKVETWLNRQTFDYFVGNHDGYRRLADPVLHRRFVFHVKGGLWFVRDLAEGAGSHLFESFWHFAPEFEVREERGAVFAESGSPGKTDRAVLSLLFAGEPGWKIEISESWVSRAYGSKEVAPMVRASAHAKLPQECGVLLLPTTQPSDVGTLVALDGVRVQGVRGYRYQTVCDTEFLFFGEGLGSWRCGPWSSDASFLYCKLKDGRPAQVVMVSGTFAEWNDKQFVSDASPGGCFEWRHHPDNLGADMVRDFEFRDSVS